ncbi:hypothetical protein N6H18_00895 [Reichenbachiella agarivorans]|uniref:Uncharacterized protein n=1 Tax=Reichenbachiella agarivorans TaxID=2979464 RepID=A0ABY6CT25_9BACT|nr:hypothetical protein [Reichenbachiella agarivorans]UXP32533.1 hypothetical protein N6H18_00895 [Reichenbachiella agarivorans]
MKDINIRDEHSVKTIHPKMRLLKKKMKKGVPLELFFKKGHGMKTIMDKTGRLMDFKGVFVISSMDDSFLLAGISDRVLTDIQHLTRSTRKKDQIVLDKITQHFGFHTVMTGQRFLRSMTVSWLEIASEADRFLFGRALSRVSSLVIR